MGSKPKVVKQDPEGDARRAAEKATAEANTKKPCVVQVAQWVAV